VMQHTSLGSMSLGSVLLVLMLGALAFSIRKIRQALDQAVSFLHIQGHLYFKFLQNSFSRFRLSGHSYFIDPLSRAMSRGLIHPQLYN